MGRTPANTRPIGPSRASRTTLSTDFVDNPVLPRRSVPRPDMTAEQLALAIESPGCQRWNARRARYRPHGEVFDTRTGTVELIDERDAKQFVCTQHYSGTYVAARVRVGLFVKRAFRPERLAGVAVFSVPMGSHVLPAYFPELGNDRAIELGRFVLLDEVEAMAESWMLARAFRKLREVHPRISAVLSFCDPVERRNERGEIVKRTHTGIVYRALGARFVGRSSPRTHLVAPSGFVISPRALSKLRNGESGAAYVEEQLRRYGLPPRVLGESGDAYVHRLCANGLLRREAHPGNLAFAFRWDRPLGLEKKMDRP